MRSRPGTSSLALTARPWYCLDDKPSHRTRTLNEASVQLWLTMNTDSSLIIPEHRQKIRIVKPQHCQIASTKSWMMWQLRSPSIKTLTVPSLLSYLELFIKTLSHRIAPIVSQYRIQKKSFHVPRPLPITKHKTQPQIVHTLGRDILLFSLGFLLWCS